MDLSNHRSSLAIQQVSTGIPMVCHHRKRSDLGSAKVTEPSIRFHHKLYGTKWNTLGSSIRPGKSVSRLQWFLPTPRWFPPTLDWFNRLPGRIHPTTEVPLAIPKFSTDIPMVCHHRKRSGLGSAKATDTSIRFHHKLYGTKWNTSEGSIRPGR